MEVHEIQLPPPRYWQQFEDLCLDLFASVWNDPTAQKNGRQGQPQAGTDISGRNRTTDGSWHGVQCKGKDGKSYRSSVTAKELREEVEKAKVFKPALKHWILATTAPKDAKIEQLAREISEEHRENGLFEVQVLGWDDLLFLLGKYPDLVHKLYKPLLPEPLGSQIEQLIGVSASETLVVEKVTRIETATTVSPPSAPADPSSAADAELMAKIDTARNLLQSGQPRSSLAELEKLEADYWESASSRAKFRLLTNLGAANHELGQYKTAARLFERAHEFRQDDPVGDQNLAAAYLFLGRIVEARVLSSSILVRDPSSPQAGVVRILAGIDEEGVDDPFALLPLELGENAAVNHAAAQWYREKGRLRDALRASEKAHDLDPTSPLMRTQLGAALVESVVTTPSAQFRNLSDAQQEALERGIALLRQAWDEVRQSERASSFTNTAANLAVALRYLNRTKEAKALVEEARASAPNDALLLAQMAWLLPAAEALPLIEALEQQGAELDHGGLSLKAASLAEVGRLEEALSTLDRIGVELHPTEQFNRIHILWDLGRREEAEAVAGQATEVNANDPAGWASLSWVKEQTGDAAAARAAAFKAYELVSTDTDAITRQRVADALYEAEEWDAAADLVRPIAGTKYDNKALRVLAIALLNGDRRRELIALLSSLDPSVAQSRFFERVAAFAYERVGNYEEARAHLDGYLRLKPDSLEMRLFWLSLVERLGDLGARDAFLDSPLDGFTGASPRELLTLAQVLNRNGRTDRALELGYQTLRTLWHDPQAHYGYAGLMLASETDGKIPEVEAIGPNTSFELLPTETEPFQFYTIESELTPINPALHEIDPASDLARRAGKLRPGDKLKVSASPVAGEREIAAVKHKFLQLFHYSLDQFNNLFPGETGLLKVPLDEANIRVFAEARSTLVHQAIQAYRSKLVPISFVSRLAGRTAIDAWYGLIEAGEKIQVCPGDPETRRSTLELLRMRPALIIDPLTLWIAGALNLADVLFDTFGPLGVTSSTLDLLEQCRDERADLRPGGSMGLTDQGGLFFVEATIERQRASLELADNIVKFARSERCVVLPAVPKVDLHSSLRQIGRELGHGAFIDTIVAAEGSGRILLSEDERFRGLASLETKRSGVWLQVALSAAMQAGKMDAAAFDQASANLALAGHHFTFVSKEILFHVVRRNAWSSNGEFRRICQVLGDSEFVSMLAVAANFLRGLWSEAVGSDRKEDLTSALLDGVTAARSTQAERIGKYLREHGRPKRGGEAEKNLRQRRAFREFMNVWLAELARSPIGRAATPS